MVSDSEMPRPGIEHRAADLLRQESTNSAIWKGRHAAARAKQAETEGGITIGRLVSRKRGMRGHGKKRRFVSVTEALPRSVPGRTEVRVS